MDAQRRRGLGRIVAVLGERLTDQAALVGLHAGL